MAIAINQNVPLAAGRNRGVTVTGVLLSFLIFYVIAFPKGGIKAYGVPLTIGYVFTGGLLILAMLRGRSLSLPLDRLIAFLTCLALGLWSAFVVYSNGTISFGYTMAYFTSVFYLPVFGLVVFSSLIFDEHHAKIERAIIWAVRFVAAYGIFLFLFKTFTGKWIEIPYLTVNVADIGQLDDKYIRRGAFFKLISTYNNGNIFGVSMIILAPLYLRLDKNILFKYIFYIALFLTLSRTVWIGLLLVLIIRSLSNGIRPMSVLYLVVALALSTGIVLGVLSIIGINLSFLTDSNLGGRLYQLDILSDAHFIPREIVDALPEIAYLGVIKYYGIFGLLLFSMHLFMPSLLMMLEGVRILSPSRASACVQGLLIYMVMAAADAAFSFIPVMMIFWMVAGMGFWYAHRQAVVLKGMREASR